MNIVLLLLNKAILETSGLTVMCAETTVKEKFSGTFSLFLDINLISSSHQSKNLLYKEF